MGTLVSIYALVFLWFLFRPDVALSKRLDRQYRMAKLKNWTKVHVYAGPDYTRRRISRVPWRDSESYTED